MSSSFSSKDVLIIGSGIGGLSVAIILAKLGFRVAVVEKNPLPGGLMRSYTRKGIECPVGVHYLGSLDEGQILRRFFDYLGVTEGIPVERMGADGVVDRYILGDRTFDLPEGFDAFEERLKRACPNDHSQINTFIKNLKVVGRQLDTLDFLFSRENDLTMLEYLEPLGEMLDKLGCSMPLRTILGVFTFWMGVPLEVCPCLYHHFALVSYLVSSWRLKCSGTDMAEAFVTRLKGLGGRIIQGDGAEEILVNARVVEGIRLGSGRVLKAPIVIATVHPKVALGMLPRGAVRPSYRKRISQLEDTPGLLSVHVAVDASAHEEMPYNIIRVDPGENGSLSNHRFYQLRKSGRPGENILSILAASTEEIWRPWEGTTSGRRGREYLEVKIQEGWRLIREAEEILGRLKEKELLDVSTPLTARDWVNSPGGSAYGILRSSGQMISAGLLNRTSVRGLFLAGQSVMAPGVIGTIMGSFRTVRSLIGHDEFRRVVEI